MTCTSFEIERVGIWERGFRKGGNFQVRIFFFFSIFPFWEGKKKVLILGLYVIYTYTQCVCVYNRRRTMIQRRYFSERWILERSVKPGENEMGSLKRKVLSIFDIWFDLFLYFTDFEVRNFWGFRRCLSIWSLCLFLPLQRPRELGLIYVTRCGTSWLVQLTFSLYTYTTFLFSLISFFQGHDFGLEMK